MDIMAVLDAIEQNKRQVQIVKALLNTYDQRFFEGVIPEEQIEEQQKADAMQGILQAVGICEKTAADAEKAIEQFIKEQEAQEEARRVVQFPRR